MPCYLMMNHSEPLERASEGSADAAERDHPELELGHAHGGDAGLSDERDRAQSPARGRPGHQVVVRLELGATYARVRAEVEPEASIEACLNALPDRIQRCQPHFAIALGRLGILAVDEVREHAQATDAPAHREDRL